MKSTKNILVFFIRVRKFLLHKKRSMLLSIKHISLLIEPNLIFKKTMSSISSHTLASTVIHVSSRSITSSFLNSLPTHVAHVLELVVPLKLCSFIHWCDHVTRSCGFPCHFNSLRHAEWNCILYLLSCTISHKTMWNSLLTYAEEMVCKEV